jgi:hypothetical protein
MTDPAVFVEKLRETLDEARKLASRLIESEKQANRLLSSYVALHQLHVSLDPRTVRTAIVDIAVNLLGAERFALLLADNATVFVAEASSRDELTKYCIGTRYIGGEPIIDAALADHSLKIGPFDNSEAAAVIPLCFEDIPVGALAILKLFDHKPVLANEDRDLLALLAVHAASALYASRVHAFACGPRGVS